MIWFLKIFGITIASIERWEVVEETEEEEEPSIIGGSSGSFEIDSDPMSPEDRYIEWEYDFGFSPPRRTE